MGKIVISTNEIKEKIGALKKEMELSPSDTHKISSISKIELLNSLLDNYMDNELEIIPMKDLRMKYLSQSRDSMSRWLERTYPNGVILTK